MLRGRNCLRTAVAGRVDIQGKYGIVFRRSRVAEEPGRRICRAASGNNALIACVRATAGMLLLRQMLPKNGGRPHAPKSPVSPGNADRWLWQSVGCTSAVPFTQRIPPALALQGDSWYEHVTLPQQHGGAADIAIACCASSCLTSGMIAAQGIIFHIAPLVKYQQ